MLDFAVNEMVSFVKTGHDASFSPVTWIIKQATIFQGQRDVTWQLCMKDVSFTAILLRIF